MPAAIPSSNAAPFLRDNISDSANRASVAEPASVPSVPAGMPVGFLAKSCARRLRNTDPMWLNLSFMPVAVPSFAKINLGLRIGPLRPDGFHELRTVYQTIALHDVLRVSVVRGTGIEIRCDDPRVPCDSSNTCHKIAERTVDALKIKGRVVIGIEKRLPVQGGLGGASGNAVAAMLALERAVRKKLDPAERLRIASEVGSDLPLFLIGGTVLGVGRGEEVYPLPDLPTTACVIALPEIAVSTPKAFSDWDELCGAGALAREKPTGKGAASSRAEMTSQELSHS